MNRLENLDGSNDSKVYHMRLVPTQENRKNTVSIGGMSYKVQVGIQQHDCPRDLLMKMIKESIEAGKGFYKEKGQAPSIIYSTTLPSTGLVYSSAFEGKREHPSKLERETEDRIYFCRMFADPRGTLSLPEGRFKVRWALGKNYSNAELMDLMIDEGIETIKQHYIEDKVSPKECTIKGHIKNGELCVHSKTK